LKTFAALFNGYVGVMQILKLAKVMSLLIGYEKVLATL
jgi:hypothetical protein